MKKPTKNASPTEVPKPRQPKADPDPSTDDAPAGRELPPFEGFADSKMAFFKALASHQTRDWFIAHKADYLEGWHGPMESLLHDVHARVDDAFEYVELAAPKVFRIYKDVRFAKDKTPYKTHVAGILLAKQRGGTKVTEMPAVLYVSVGVGVGDDANITAHGQYEMAPEQIELFRAAILDDRRGAEVARICASLEKAGFRLTSASSLKKVPRGIDPDHPRAELLKRKGLIASGPPIPAELLTSPKLVDYLAKQILKAAPLINWLVETTRVSSVTTIH
jgi:uncharacterized protein (TIGR02453 family)